MFKISKVLIAIMLSLTIYVTNIESSCLSVGKANEISQVKAKNKKARRIKLIKRFKGINKTYMDLKYITRKDTKQYKLKKKYRLDRKGHYYYKHKNKKFYVVALGGYFGKIGDKFKIKLSSGKTFYAIMGDKKDDKDTYLKYCHKGDYSVIEFIVNTSVAKKYYGCSNGYVANGNLNNSKLWKGKIASVYKLL